MRVRSLLGGDVVCAVLGLIAATALHDDWCATAERDAASGLELLRPYLPPLKGRSQQLHLSSLLSVG